MKRKNPVDEISEDDYTIADAGRLGSQYRVSGMGTFDTFRECILAIVKDMEKNQFWPSVFYINDHGNVDQIAISIGKNGIRYRTVK